MFERNLQYFGPLTFDPVTGFAINPNKPGGNENAFAAKDFRNILVAIIGTGNVKFHGSFQKDPPDFTAASTITNEHDTIVSADYAIQNTFYNGAVGVTVAGATKQVELNTNLLTWFTIQRSINTVGVIVTVTDNL